MANTSDNAEAQEKSVSVGSTVVIEKNRSQNRKELKIVLSHEANISANQISDLSPMGMALMGKKVGEVATLKTPSGELQFTIVEVR